MGTLLVMAVFSELHWIGPPLQGFDNTGCDAARVRRETPRQTLWGSQLAKYTVMENHHILAFILKLVP